MATNAPPSRKTHIVRIVGTNKAGERLDNIWLDIERMDIIKGKINTPEVQGQEFQLKLRWHDDPDGEDEFFMNGPPSRLVRILKVCDPDSQDVDDPDEWVPVPVIRGMRSRGGGSESMGQGFMDRFRVAETDDGPETARVAVVRKIVHYDTNIDDDAQSAFDADPGRTNYVVSGEFYQKEASTKDDSQSVEHEITTFLKLKTNGDVMGLGRQTKLLNQYLIDESEAPDGDVVGVSGINPPYRADPFQNIVNCQFNPDKAVFIGLGDEADNSGIYTSLYSEDGQEFDVRFAGVSAASGFNRTVVTSAASGKIDYVSFGKPRDGEACFIVARRTGTIERGTMVNGEISWSTIASIPLVDPLHDFINSCHFAGGAFFIGYSDVGGDAFRYAVSFDGASFTFNVNPFPGVAAAAIGTDADDDVNAFPLAGGVAYDPGSKRYVVVGSYARNFAGEFFNGVINIPFDSSDINFMSSVSSDGLSWSPFFETSETGIFGENPGGRGGCTIPNCSVAFGNGTFVACANTKVPVIDHDFFDLSETRYLAASSVSVNGSSWSGVSELPGLAAPKLTNSSSGVIFCKHRGLGEGIDGFFLMAALDKPGDVITGRLFYSLTGTGWSQVHSERQVPFFMSLIRKQTDNSVVVSV